MRTSKNATDLGGSCVIQIHQLLVHLPLIFSVSSRSACAKHLNLARKSIVSRREILWGLSAFLFLIRLEITKAFYSLPKLLAELPVVVDVVAGTHLVTVHFAPGYFLSLALVLHN